MTPETIAGLLDHEIEYAIARLHATLVELDRDITALRSERDRREREREQRLGACTHKRAGGMSALGAKRKGAMGNPR